jgi:hypothetical protein
MDLWEFAISIHFHFNQLILVSLCIFILLYVGGSSLFISDQLAQIPTLFDNILLPQLSN